MTNHIDFVSKNIQNVNFVYGINHLEIVFNYSINKTYHYCLAEDFDEILTCFINAKSKGKFVKRKLNQKNKYNIFNNGCMHINFENI
ncbi:hypothetical protein [Mesoplasma florum]|uniref:hypothetical protein n=1 Tax=Mesoplasma florum TaxID=2151 RepID=UPI00131A06B5|nr:hypothetical protein [Mesoplasma florum]